MTELATPWPVPAKVTAKVARWPAAELMEFLGRFASFCLLAIHGIRRQDHDLSSGTGRPARSGKATFRADSHHSGSPAASVRDRVAGGALPAGLAPAHRHDAGGHGDHEHGRHPQRERQPQRQQHRHLLPVLDRPEPVGQRRDDLGGVGGPDRQRRGQRQRRPVQGSGRCGGGWRGQRVRGGRGQRHDPQNHAGRSGHYAGGVARSGRQRRRNRQRRPVQRAGRCGGGQRGLCLCGGHGQRHDPYDHAGREGHYAGGDARSARQRRRNRPQRPVQRAGRCGGGQLGRHLCGGHGQRHDPYDDAG